MTVAGKIGELVNWTSVEVVVDFEPPNPSIIVSGTLPFPMEVVLEPFPETLREPEYWPTKVIGCHGAGSPEVITDYSVQVSLSHLPTGTKGIELIGKDQTQEIDIPES
jgi:hypothetical protein